MSQAFQPIFLDVAKRGQKPFFLILILLFLGSRGPLFEPFMSVCPPHLAPSFFEKVQIGCSGAPEFWIISERERPSGPHFENSGHPVSTPIEDLSLHCPPILIFPCTLYIVQELRGNSELLTYWNHQDVPTSSEIPKWTRTNPSLVKKIENEFGQHLSFHLKRIFF